MKVQSMKVFLGGAFLLASVATAGTIKSSGTAGASQLLIPVGAQNIALGAANTAGASGVEAMYINPAGIGAMKGGFEGTVSNMEYIADIKVFFSGFVANIGNIGSIGLAVSSLDFGDIAITTADQTEGTGETFSPSFATFTASYAKSFFDRVRFGANLKFIQERIINTGATGFAVDMGVQYRFADQPISVGVVLRNLGNRMEYQGSDLEQNLTPAGAQSGSMSERFRVKAEAFELPTTMSMGVNYSPMPGLDLIASFNNNSFAPNTIALGGKFDLGPAWIAGGTSTLQVDDTEKTSSVSNTAWQGSTESIWGPTFGAGLDFSLGDMNLGIAYSMRTLNKYFSDTSVLQVTVGF